LLYPSLHDSGGQVVLEAMAAGLPVICTTRGGPAVLVDENAGWKVAANHPKQTIARLSEALKEFADSSELRMARGISARSRATQLFSTEAFGKRQRDCYRQILGPAD
jgi:glycosyltransferase involved in cell wall biosynthesis